MDIAQGLPNELALVIAQDAIMGHSLFYVSQNPVLTTGYLHPFRSPFLSVLARANNLKTGIKNPQLIAFLNLLKDNLSNVERQFSDQIQEWLLPLIDSLETKGGNRNLSAALWHQYVEEIKLQGPRSKKQMWDFSWNSLVKNFLPQRSLDEREPIVFFLETLAISWNDGVEVEFTKFSRHLHDYAFEIAKLFGKDKDENFLETLMTFSAETATQTVPDLPMQYSKMQIDHGNGSPEPLFRTSEHD